LLTYKTTTTINVPSTNTEWYLTLNIEQDFPRALALALAKATSSSSATNETASSTASDELDVWKQAFIAAYAIEDVTLNIKSNAGLTFSLGHDRNVGITDKVSGSTITKSYHIPDLTFSDYVFLRWKSPEAISAISASIRVNCKLSGLYGWNYTTLVFLNATVISISKSGSEYNVTLLVTNERGPIEGLGLDNFEVLGIPTLYLYVFGGGKYILSFSTSAVTVDIKVIDDRGICVYIKDVELS